MNFKVALEHDSTDLNKARQKLNFLFHVKSDYINHYVVGIIFSSQRIVVHIYIKSMNGICFPFVSVRLVMRNENNFAHFLARWQFLFIRS